MDELIEKIAAELVSRGYFDCGQKAYSVSNRDRYDPMLFQKVIRTEKGKRFINVWNWDLRELYKDRGRDLEGGLSYEVVAHFETEGGPWVEIKFHGIVPDKLLDVLDEYEQLISESFERFKGVHQD